MIAGAVRKLTGWFYSNLREVIPKAITASAIVVIGYIVAKIIEKLSKRILRSIELNKWTEEKGIRESLFGIDLEKNISEVLKWYVILLFFREAFSNVGMETIASFFSKILVLLPSWAIGLGILAIFLIIADKLRRRIKDTGIIFSSIAGDIGYGIVLFFGLVLALPKFGFKNINILVDSFKILVGGFSAGVALAIGIGFGMAIKEGPAREFFKKKE